MRTASPPGFWAGTPHTAAMPEQPPYGKHLHAALPVETATAQQPPPKTTHALAGAGIELGPKLGVPAAEVPRALVAAV